MEKLDKVIRALECHYEMPGDDCIDTCPYSGEGNCLDPLMKDCLEVLRELRTDNERLTRRWTDARNDLINEQMRSRDYESKALVARAERDIARRKILELEAELFTLRPVHAHWIRVGWGHSKCSHCEAEVAVVSGHKNYCANCGAHMDEKLELRTCYCPLCHKHFEVRSNESMGDCPECGHHVVLYRVGVDDETE